MIDIAEINDVSVFAELVGSEFRIEVGPDRFVNAKLLEAEALNKSGQTGHPSRREPFALLFELPEGTELAQLTYKVSQEALGEMPLFLVPVGPRQMESIFN